MNARNLSTTAAIAAAAAVLLAPTSGHAQPEPPDATIVTIDAATRTQVIGSVLKTLNESYVFPEVARKMETAIRQREAAGEYAKVTSATAFAEKLTNDLRAVCHDKHLGVRFSAGRCRPVPPPRRRTPRRSPASSASVQPSTTASSAWSGWAATSGI